MGSYIRIPVDASLPFSSLFWRSKGQGISSLLSRSEVKDYLFYSYGRVAFLAGLKILACKEGSNVLLPSYICRVVLEPFHELGIEARFYKVSLNLQPDIKDIRNRIDEKTKGIMVVNYFGFPQDIGEIQNICEKYRLYLIEDNAHGFLSKKNSRLLGTFGDIGFSCIWKVLPVPNGAVLFVNDDKLMDKKENMTICSASQAKFPRMGRWNIYTYILNSLLSNLELRYRFNARFIRDIYRKIFLKGKRSSHKKFQDSKVRIAQFSLKIATNTNLEYVCRRRRENYNFWLNEMYDRKDVHIIFKDLPEGICPLNFLVIAEEGESFLQEMLEKGIPAYYWPPLPKEIKDSPEYPISNFLAKHVVVLPVHQSLDRDYLARVINR
jgi:dTDP-4-amino-4,6-dideoxygalactose transaminase